MAIDILKAELSELERLGSVSQTPEAPPCEPFSASAPFPLEETDFTDEERIDALAGAVRRTNWNVLVERVVALSCKCGHRADRHETEMPYPCYDCDCASYELDYAEDDDDSTNS